MSWGLSAASVRYGSRLALEALSFEAAPSSVTVVIGGDGAGKSTALRALVGLVHLDGGSAARPAKHEIGYIPAFGGIYTDLTVQDNLAFSGRAYGITGTDLAERSSRVLARVGLDGVEDRLGGHLSGGMQRKLAVAVALLHRPALLVLDEPTTGVDPVSRAQLWRLVAGEAASGTAVVVSTTYVNEARRANSVLLLDRGRAIASGDPEEVVAATPGAVGVVDGATRPEGTAWLRGRSWRVWEPDGTLPATAAQVAPDFSDAVIVAELVAGRAAIA